MFVVFTSSQKPTVQAEAVTTAFTDKGLGDGFQDEGPKCTQDVYVIPDDENELLHALDTEPGADNLKHATLLKLDLSLHAKPPSKP